MASCCLGTNCTVKEFTFLLIQVLHVSHPAALEGSTYYAREVVNRFLGNIRRLTLVILPHTSINFNTGLLSKDWKLLLLENREGLRTAVTRFTGTSIQKGLQ